MDTAIALTNNRSATLSISNFPLGMPQVTTHCFKRRDMVRFSFLANSIHAFPSDTTFNNLSPFHLVVCST